MDTTAPFLITAATGKTGRRVAERLTGLGLPVRAASRSATPPLDWERPATWGPALDGARGAYVAFAPDLAVPGGADTVAAFARAAASAGLQRLVLLSGRGEDAALHAEHLVRDAFPATTVVRCSWFMQNFTEGQFLPAVLDREIALPVDGVPEPFVDCDDIADVAVAALTQDGHAGVEYELTGPRALTFAEAAAAIGSAIGEEVAFTSVPADAYAEGMRAAGLPEDVVGLVGFLFSEVLDGRNASPADGVQRALGRPPRDFAAFARDAAAKRIWGAR